MESDQKRWVPDAAGYAVIVEYLEKGLPEAALEVVAGTSGMSPEDSRAWLDEFVERHFRPSDFV